MRANCWIARPPLGRRTKERDACEATHHQRFPSGAPSQLKAFLDRLQPYFYANWRAKPKRPASLYVVGEGGDPHGFGPLVGEVRSALAVAGFALESVHDGVGLVGADGALPSGADVFEGGRVHPASAYTCTGPEGTFPLGAGTGGVR